jgi:hypothetical protein
MPCPPGVGWWCPFGEAWLYPWAFPWMCWRATPTLLGLPLRTDLGLQPLSSAVAIPCPRALTRPVSPPPAAPMPCHLETVQMH